ncbi:MAG: hypothetical protein LBT51_00585 [Fusobacteriaceae bacterium]|nr:hypothetical protein [Fusobacteriaceae bacterium]
MGHYADINAITHGGNIMIRINSFSYERGAWTTTNRTNKYSWIENALSGFMEVFNCGEDYDLSLLNELILDEANMIKNELKIKNLTSRETNILTSIYYKFKEYEDTDDEYVNSMTAEDFMQMLNYMASCRKRITVRGKFKLEKVVGILHKLIDVMPERMFSVDGASTLNLCKLDKDTEIIPISDNHIHIIDRRVSDNIISIGADIDCRDVDPMGIITDVIVYMLTLTDSSPLFNNTIMYDCAFDTYEYFSLNPNSIVTYKVNDLSDIERIKTNLSELTYDKFKNHDFPKAKTIDDLYINIYYQYLYKYIDMARSGFPDYRQWWGKHFIARDNFNKELITEEIFNNVMKQLKLYTFESKE